MHGVIIESGPMDYQILQRSEEGSAKFILSGRYERFGSERNQTVYVRVCHQDNGVPLIWWRPAVMSGDTRFSAELELPTGGPYRIETAMHHAAAPSIERSFRGDTRFHIYVGDLYVIAGQSNSAGYGKDPVPDAPMPGVHLFRNRGNWDIAVHPLNDSTGSVFPDNIELGNPGHSPWLGFAKELRRVTGVPVGLIQSAKGGSPISDWSPEGGKLYASMLERINICGGAVRGMLWYQGESDASPDLAETYLERFSAMITGLRGHFADIHIFTVQLNRFTTDINAENDMAWGIVREAQRQAAQRLDRVYIVPSSDCSTSDFIHNSALGNLKIGQRAANQALHHIYGLQMNYLAPNLTRVIKLNDTTVSLYFENVYERLYFFDRDPLGIPFEITDESGINAVVNVELLRDSVKLTLERPIVGGAKIGMAYQRNSADVVPVDTATYMPILSFYGVVI
jgi:hypothetical protein